MQCNVKMSYLVVIFLITCYSNVMSVRHNLALVSTCGASISNVCYASYICSCLDPLIQGL